MTSHHIRSQKTFANNSQILIIYTFKFNTENVWIEKKIRIKRKIIEKKWRFGKENFKTVIKLSQQKGPLKTCCLQKKTIFTRRLFLDIRLLILLSHRKILKSVSEKTFHMNRTMFWKNRVATEDGTWTEVYKKDGNSLTSKWCLWKFIKITKFLN